VDLFAGKQGDIAANKVILRQIGGIGRSEATQSRL
jgi:hypothetical protein